MSIFISILFILAAVVMLLKKNKPGALVCIVLILFMAFIQLFLTPSTADRASRFDRKSKAVKADVLAKRISERHPGESITLLGMPDIKGTPEDLKQGQKMQVYLMDAFDKLGVEVKEAFMPMAEGAIRNLEKTLLSGADPDNEEFFPREAYLMTVGNALAGFDAHQLNKMLTDLHGVSDVVVCTLPLTSRIFADELLPREKGPALVLMHVDVDDVEYALEQTVLDMYLSYSPNASWELDYEWPKNSEAAFDYRYTLVTRKGPVALR